MENSNLDLCRLKFTNLDCIPLKDRVWKHAYVMITIVLLIGSIGL